MIERGAEEGCHGCLSRPGYAYRLRQSLRRIDEAEGDMHEVFAGEAVNPAAAPSLRNHPEAYANAITVATGRPFILAGDMSPEGPSADPVIAAAAAIRGLAVVLLEIARDAAAAAAAPKELTSLAAASLEVIADEARLIAGGGGHGPARATPPALIRSVLGAIDVLGSACNGMRSVFAGERGAGAGA